MLKNDVKPDNLNVANKLKQFNETFKDSGNSDITRTSNGISYDGLLALYDVSQAINSTLILEDMLDIVMIRAIKLLSAERGFLMLLDDEGNLKFHTAHNIKLEQLGTEDMKISTSIANIVVQSGEAVYTADALQDDRFARKASIIDLNIRSAMCVPLKIKKKMIGVLYVDNSSKANVFLKQDLVLFEMFADQAAVAILNARLYTEVLEFQKYQQNIFSNIPIGLLVIDNTGIITEVNEACDSIFTKAGWSNYPPIKAGMIGLKLKDIIPENYAEMFLDSIREAVAKPVEMSRLNTDSSDDEFVLQLKFYPFENYESKPAGHIILIEDITEQVILEQYLILSEKLIAKGEMAAAVGHELNNYLTVISTNAQLLSINLTQGKMDKVKDKVDIIVENVDHIKRFSDGLMDFSTLESKFVYYDIRRLIEDIVFFVHPQKAFKEIKFDIDLPGSLPDVYIDVGQIHQVFLNLFINASDEFASSNEGEGKISIKAGMDEDNFIKITISDNGSGIQEEILPRIFQPHVTSKKTGHGFGLWTCFRIVENHGGKILARNNKEKGASFEIILPRGPDDK